MSGKGRRGREKWRANKEIVIVDEGGRERGGRGEGGGERGGSLGLINYLI